MRYSTAGFLVLHTALALPVLSATANDAITVAIREGSTAGGLNVSHPLLPGNILAYLSCEAVVLADKGDSTPLFEVKLSESPDAQGRCWRVEQGTYAYSWTYEAGIRVDFSATPEGDCLRLRYTLKNESEAPMKRVILHTCIPTTEAPAFFSEFLESEVHEPGKTGNYMGFYDRTFLWLRNQPFAIGETAKGKEEIHLSFTRAGQPAVKWGWWNDGPERFDFPFIALASKDGAFTTALGFESAEWASCNGGDDRACFHLFPLFGDLEPGQEKTVEGAFYLMPGTPESARARFNQDFPEVGKVSAADADIRR